MYNILVHFTTFIVCLLGLIMAFGLKTQANEMEEKKYQEESIHSLTPLSIDDSSFGDGISKIYDISNISKKNGIQTDIFAPKSHQDSDTFSNKKSENVFLSFSTQNTTSSKSSSQKTSDFQQTKNIGGKKYVHSSSTASIVSKEDFSLVLPPIFIRYDIPFFPQAPYGDWSEPRDNACEEASILIAYYGTLGITVSKQKFILDIQKMIEWEGVVFNGSKSINLRQVQRIFTDYLGYKNVDFMRISSPNDIKKELADGNLVIAGFAGRKLGNPYYYGQGPLYHMMVIVGYEENQFIVHDVGTRRGAYYRYDENVLFTALHDYVSGDITAGAKNILVIKNP